MTLVLEPAEETRESSVKVLRILLVEDSEDDAVLVTSQLRRAGFQPRVRRVEELEPLREALRTETWDLVISDWSLPRMTGAMALSEVQAAGIDTPFIIVSGSVSEEVIVDAMHRGAHDYVLKDKLTRLGAAVHRELREYRVREGKRQAELEVRESEARYRLLFDSTPTAIWVYDLATFHILAGNEAALKLYGYTRDEFTALTLPDLRPPEELESLRQVVAHRTNETQLWTNRRKDGALLVVEHRGHDIQYAGKEARLVIATDVTERKRLEEQLRQSQKMEAVGRLAGGVAHDFNNILSVILSYGELVLMEMGAEDPSRDDVSEMCKAGKAAAELTHQLLLFSRQQVVEPKILDLNTTLASMDKMLQRLLGADIDLVSLPGKQVGHVRVDPGSLEQVIMNLVVNARDAMPTGGKLTMETGNVHLDESYARHHHDVIPGVYSMLAVSDTGEGMDAATQARIFEPFFTTKERGKGTGLGLSTVFGIVKQAVGSVWVYSEVGKGTTFKIYLPHVEVTADHVALRAVAPPKLDGTETVLLVEDNMQVRTVALEILRKYGYRVLEAARPRDALELVATSDEPIHLLLSDVVMPDMSGPELAKRVSERRAGLKVLCMSGYTDDSIVRHGVLDANVAYLQKPFTPDALASKVREVLDAPERALNAP